jgi:thiazole tautomerase (transcriptional regulator TenI)
VSAADWSPVKWGTADWGTAARPGHAILCAVTDRSRLPADAAGLDGLVRRLGQAAAAGVDLLQIREPDLSGGELVTLVQRVLAAASETPARVIVNDRVDVALTAGAAGVHLKGESIETAAVRRFVPAGFLVGRSVHSAEEAERAAADGADYVIVGTVFETASKPGEPASGLDLLRETVRRCRAPVLGIGGMTAARAAAVAATGAAGLAAIGLFMGSAGTAEQVGLNLDTTVSDIRRAFASRASEDRAWP